MNDADPICAIIARTLTEGIDYGPGYSIQTCQSRGCSRTIQVQYKGELNQIWVHDFGLRPPHPDGVWLDDLVVVACRRLFGSKTGSCRPLAGCEYLEFRDHWNEPVRYKLDRQVRVTRQKMGDHEEIKVVCRVQMSAYPGADEEALILARTHQECEKNWGSGQAKFETGRTDSVIFVPMPISVTESVPCRYTIHRTGGIAHEIIISLPPLRTMDWKAILLSVGVKCRQMFGTGTLQYEPELGETHFRYV